MSLLKSLYKPIDSLIKNNDANNGYHRTRTAAIPSSLKYESSWKTINSKAGNPVIGVTMSPVGMKLVEPKCIDLARSVTAFLFRATSDAYQMIVAEIPMNSICVTVACANFLVGDHCHQFYPKPQGPEEGAQHPGGGTHLHTEGIRFHTNQAQRHTKDTKSHTKGGHFHTNNEHLHTQGANLHTNESHSHTQAGHLHTNNEHLHTEGAKLHTKAGPLHANNEQLHTQAGHLHANNEHMHTEGAKLHTESASLHTNQKFRYTNETHVYTKEAVHLPSGLAHLPAHLAFLHTRAEQLHTEGTHLHTKPARHLTDWAPPSTKEPGSWPFFTWQRLSANVQACYYHEEGIEYLAGICYYPVLLGRSKRILNDSGLIQYHWLAREVYPLRDREDTPLFRETAMYSRYCSMIRKRVLVDLSDQYTRHVLYAYSAHERIQEMCLECHEDSVLFMSSRAKKELITNLEHTIETNDAQFKQLENLMKIGDQEPTILVFNRLTGQLLEPSKWPKMSKLDSFLLENPDINVHVNSALQAHLILRDGFQDRIGGGPEQMEQVEVEPELEPELEEQEEEEVEPVENLIAIYSPRGEPSDESLGASARSTDLPISLTLSRMNELGLSDLNLACYDRVLPIDTLIPIAPSYQEPGTSSTSSSMSFISADVSVEYITDC